MYTEGIEVNCNDKDLNAKLYNNRALAHYHLGKLSFIFKSCIFNDTLYFVLSNPWSFLHASLHF